MLVELATSPKRKTKRNTEVRMAGPSQHVCYVGLLANSPQRQDKEEEERNKPQHRQQGDDKYVFQGRSPEELAPAWEHRDPHEPTRLSTKKMLETAPALKHFVPVHKNEAVYKHM